MLLQKHQPIWAHNFEQIKSLILKTLFELNINVDKDIAIEHIGSTSIPNLAAKPIIDIDLVYGAAIKFEELKKGLEKIGYYHNGDQGIKDREAFKRIESKEKNKVLDGINHHLYVCPYYSAEHQRHLLFRDFLIAHEEERQQYEDLKFAIAEEACQDKGVYAKIKETRARDFINSIIEKARSSQ